MYFLSQRNPCAKKVISHSTQLFSQRGVGNARGTWRWTLERDIEEADKTWKEFRQLAQDRSEWRAFVCTYASLGSEREVRGWGSMLMI